MKLRRVAILTAGGFAPCLSAAVGNLIKRYTKLAPEVEIIGYTYGYQGLLTGEYLKVDDETRRRASLLRDYGGSPIGNSRVKLTNHQDLVRRKLIPRAVDPLMFAAQRLQEDNVDILHTVGGDDTNTTAADLAAHLAGIGEHLVVVGLPKTIDNDITPVRQSLGAATAAQQGARFAANVLAEHNSGARSLIVHEVMGRNCGWLTAATAKAYRDWLDTREWLPSIGLRREGWDIHGVYIPEVEISIEREAERLRAVMDEVGSVNLFISEGAGVTDIVDLMEKSGEEIPRDPFGHVRLNDINPGAWFGKQFANKLGAEKVNIQKSGYFARSAAANDEDLALIKSMTDMAVDCALNGISGLIGHDEEHADQLRAIEFPRVRGHKPFDFRQQWYVDMLDSIGQGWPESQHPGGQ